MRFSYVRSLVARALLGAAAIVACTASDQDSRGMAAGHQRDELRIGVGRDEFGLEQNRDRLGMYPLNASICEPPFRLTPAMATEPALVTIAEHLGDNTFRLTLRRDVVFHDGAGLTSAAVRETLLRSIANRTQFSFLSPSSIRVVNDSTLDITPTVPNLRLLEQLAHPTYGITAAGSDPTKHPVCTGPFRFVEYVPQDHFTVERFDGYRGTKPRIKRVTFRFIQDDNTRALALRAGELDVMYDVNRGMVNSLRRISGMS